MKYSKGYKYQLEANEYYMTGILGFDVETKWISLKPSGSLRIKDGYAWDGPSGPTIDTDSFMLGSLIHDALYELLRKELLPAEYKEKADQILKEICLEEGMWKIRAWWVYEGLEDFGKGATLPKNRRKIYEV